MYVWLDSNINLFSPKKCLAGCSEVVASYKTILHSVRQCSSSQATQHPWPAPVTMSPPPPVILTNKGGPRSFHPAPQGVVLPPALSCRRHSSFPYMVSLLFLFFLDS